MRRVCMNVEARTYPDEREEDGDGDETQAVVVDLGHGILFHKTTSTNIWKRCTNPAYLLGAEPKSEETCSETRFSLCDRVT